MDACPPSVWQSNKYEDIYMKDCEAIKELVKGLREYFWFYNNERTSRVLMARQLLRSTSLISN